MIAKISHGSSLYGVLAYNQLKVDERHADVLFSETLLIRKRLKRLLFWKIQRQ